jgi:hypothetical protein
MAKRIHNLRLFFYGRKFSIAKNKSGLRLEIQDRPYYRYGLALLYATLITAMFFGTGENSIGRILLRIPIFLIAFGGLVLYLHPFKMSRFFEIDSKGIELSSELTFTQFKGRITWASITGISKTAFTIVSRNGVITVGPFYRLERKKGPPLEIYRIFPFEVEEYFEQMLLKKKIPRKNWS